LARRLCGVAVGAARPITVDEREVGGELGRESEAVVVCAGLAVLLAGGSPVGPTPSGVRSQ
jgi:hypothetical protein